MADGGFLIIIAALSIVAAIIALIYILDTWPRRVTHDDQPNGDATETPRMLHDARRANHAKGNGEKT